MKNLFKKTLNVASRIFEILTPDDEETKRIAARYLDIYYIGPKNR